LDTKNVKKSDFFNQGSSAKPRKSNTSKFEYKKANQKKSRSKYRIHPTDHNKDELNNLFGV